jgi:hypothetical protein
MLKPFSKYAHVVFALSLMLPLALAVPADAKPSSSSSSFKSGFSSQRSSSSSSSSSSRSSSSAAKKSGGGFGSFGSSKAADANKSDSALSRKLDRERSEANALRTLDERRAAQAAREARPAPGYNQPAGGYADDRRAPPQGYGYGSAPAPAQPPIIVNNNGGGGLGHIVAGAILARSAANAHANGNNGNNGNNSNGGGYYPAPSGSAGELANQAGAGSVGVSNGATAATAAPATPAKSSGGSVFGTIVWLGVLALIGWAVYRMIKRRRARREANKPNYSFERN